MKDQDQEHKVQQSRTVKFLADFFGARPPGYRTHGFGLSAEVPVKQNQPEFWADAPWRIEPDQNEIPLLFLVRDTNIKEPAKGPWRLNQLKVDQKLRNGSWECLLTLLPNQLPRVDNQGTFQRRTWSHSLSIPLSVLNEAARGETVRLRVVFDGSYHPYSKPAPVEIHLEIFVAKDALPLSRAARIDQPRQWFYGDTHYHSAYTNDIKEIGNPVPETCVAARAVGLDWLVITDHSCDLDDVDPDVSPEQRWDRLKAELIDPQVSNAQFRCILGEEINLLGKGENFIHLLAIGGMDRMIEGAFLPDEGGFMTEVFQESIKSWLKKVAKSGGYSDKEAQRMFGTVHPFERVIAMLPEETLLFAAHPFQMAQPPPPGKWNSEDLVHPRLTGFEFWNARTRRSARMTLDPYASDDWGDPQKLIKNDQGRIRKVKAWADGAWDLVLRKGLQNWRTADALPALRPVFLAGTDAHGSFNYSIGLSWDYRRRLIVDDDALGKVRTVVYLSDEYTNIIPPEAELLSAIRKGSCVVTDGPILAFTLAQHGTSAHMGEVLTVAGDEDILMNIQAFSTPELGPVDQVELVTCFRPGRKPDKTIIKRGERVTLDLAGNQGYCRLFAQSEGPDGQLFCCFTNPTWVRIPDGYANHLVASFS
jgi:hypothetical protein